MSLADEVTRYYAARAPMYDETAGFTDPEAEQLRKPVKSRYREIFKGHSVLEIACGTGYWTKVIGEVAESVLAVDINPSVIDIARSRCKHLANVTFQIADAYTLNDIPPGFSAAIGIWWWSHMPKARINAFLTTLHSKLSPGAPVLFADHIPYKRNIIQSASDEDSLEERLLPDGRSFMVIKNFTTENEVVHALADIADNITYTEHPNEKNWEVTCITKG
jgi:SAM-dependent methyltransferase